MILPPNRSSPSPPLCPAIIIEGGIDRGQSTGQIFQGPVAEEEGVYSTTQLVTNYDLGWVSVCLGVEVYFGRLSIGTKMQSVIHPN